MSEEARELDDAKERRTVSRRALVHRSDPWYSQSRLRALVDAERLRPAVGFAWVEAGPDGLMPRSTGGDEYTGSGPRSGIVQDTWKTPTDMYYALAHGGLWRGDPNAFGISQTWSPRTDHLPSLAVNTVAGIPAQGPDPELLVLGTGDPHAFTDDATGWWGLWRSIDGGLSFHPLDGGPGASRFFADDVNEIAMVDRQRWFVATRRGLFWTQDGGRHFGANIIADDDLPLDEGNILDVRISRDNLPAGFDCAVTYAVGCEGVRRFYLPPNGLPERGPDEHRLSLRAGGLLLASPGHVAFDRAFINGVEIVAVSVGALDDREGRHSELRWGTRGSSGAWEWKDISWKGVHDTSRRAQTAYDHVVFVDPAWHSAGAQGLLYLGVVHLFAGRVQPDGTYVEGNTLVQVDKTFLHADQHHLSGDPNATFVLDGAPAQGVYSGNDGGAAFNADHGTGPWQTLGHAPTLMTYHVAMVQNGDHLVLAAGFQDNGSAGARAFVGPAATPMDPIQGALHWDWTATGGGDGGQVLLCEDGTTPGRTYMFCVQNDALTRYRRDLNDADWWLDSPGGLVPVGGADGFSATLTRAQDAAGAWNTVFFGLAGGDDTPRLYRCLTALGALSSSSFVEIDVGGQRSRITAMLAVPVAGATGEWTGLWVGQADGTVRYSADATSAQPTWEERTPPGNDRVITCIAADPRDARVIVVSTGGFSDLPARYRTGRVWMYAPGPTGALTWTDISGRDDAEENLPDMPALSVLVMGTLPRRILVGTEIGAFLTEDDGQTWQRLDLAMRMEADGRSFRRMPRVPVYALASPEPPHPEDRPPPRVAAGTYGRSVWVLLDLARYGLAAPPVPVPALYAEVDGGFGFVALGTERSRELVVANRGAVPLTLDTVVVAGSGWSLDGAPLEGVVLAPGQAERRPVRLQATSLGIRTGSLQVVCPDPDQATVSIALSAEVVPPGPGRLAILGDGYVDFGYPEATAPPMTARIVIQNVGLGPLRLQAARIDGDAWDPNAPEDGGFEALDLPEGPIAPDATAELRVVYHPRPDQWSRARGTLVLEPDTGPARSVVFAGGTGAPRWVRMAVGTTVTLLGLGIAGAAIGAAVVQFAGKRR